MSDKKAGRSNGMVTETAEFHIDKKKFDEGHKRIFGTREKISCVFKDCGLSSRQKNGKDFECPHCKRVNYFSFILSIYGEYPQGV
jgi:hypothetical protein